MKYIKALAVLVALAATFAVAVSLTPAQAETATSVQGTSCTLTTSYTDCDAYCPDNTWTASGGGYYYDYPFPAADDIDIRAFQPWASGGVQGWHMQAKWHAAISGQSRAIVAQVVCIR